MTFAYPADSGQDYAIIEEAGGMRSRVVDDGARGWRLADNVRLSPALRDAHRKSLRRRGERSMTDLSPATAPTLYFFGVTTTKSSIMKVFPAWAKHLGLTDAVIKGVDFPLRAPAQDYRDAVAFVKSDPLSQGALVTTHKIDLFHACRDQFDEIDPHAKFMGETSCLSKRDGRLVCHAKDPISSGLSLDGFLPERHFERSGRRGLLDGRRRFDDRAHLASHAEEPWRRSALPHRGLGPQRRPARGNTADPRRIELRRSN